MSRLLEAGAALLRSRQFAAAELLLQQAAQFSDGAHAWQLLGVARHRLGKRAGALQAWSRALALDPTLSDAACAVATVLAEEQRWSEAEATLRKALDAAPGSAQVHFNLAVLLERRGEGGEALEHYDAALAHGEHPAALLNRGALRMRLGCTKEALADFDRLLIHDPRSADAQVNRNRALLILKEDESALQAAEAALAFAPNRRDARLGKAIALASLGRLEEAQAVMRPLEPGWDAGAMYLTRALERQDVCDWRDRDRLVGMLRERLALPQTAASMASIGLLHRALALPLDANDICRAATAVSCGLPTPDLGPLPPPPARSRIRVTILSAGVSTHPDYFLLSALLQNLDRRRFEVFLYAFNADDGSEHRREMARAADVFVDVSELDAPAIATRLRIDAPDVALDTGGFFRAARPEVLKARVAPVQVAYLGVPCTYGAGLADYRLSDTQATPVEVQGHWLERLVLISPPHFAWCYRGDVAPAGTRQTLGLPQQSVVFCCFNQSWKIEPEAFASWMRILQAVPGAVLWLLDEGERTRLNLRRAAEARGVAPERLIFAPRTSFPEHLGRLAHADIFLDTLHYNAVTSALDTIWAGVPLVTREGATMASRLAGSFLRCAELAELVASSAEEYERIAVRLAADGEFMASARAKARAARSGRLFDAASNVRAVEAALISMVERYRRGAAPQLLHLGGTAAS